MKRHATIPEFEDVEWRGQIFRQIIKQNIANPPTANHTEEEPDEHVINL